MSADGALLGTYKPGHGLTDDEIQEIEDFLRSWEPVKIGPSWQTDDDGNWLLPQWTLGWEIAQWCARWLRHEGKPWKFTLEQLRLLLWWYAVDEHGRFTYRQGVIQRLKGHGKDPLLAVICMVELCGPSRFSHWENGLPVGKRHPNPWVQVVAVSQQQTVNTFALFPSLVSDEMKAEFGIDLGKELIYALGGTARLQAVTSNPRTLEGGRTTFTLLNETHHWVAGNGGHQMYETLQANAGKGGNRFLAITNAYLPGEDSVAERMREGYHGILEGRAPDPGLMYDSLEAPADTPLDVRMIPHFIRRLRGDSVWLNPDDVISSILDPTISPARSRRMWLNQIVAGEDKLYGPEQIDPLLTSLIFQDGDEIVLGFDGSKSRDATALVGLRLKDRLVQPLGIWERPLGEAGDGWEVDREEVDSAVHEAHRRYKVRAFYGDVEQWESYIDSWSRLYGESYAVRASAKSAIGWDFRASQKLVTLAHERLVGTIFDARLQLARSAKPLLGGVLDVAQTLRRHILNAVRRENNYGLSFGKESKDSPKKVDGYAALMAAHEAEHDYHERGSKAPKKKRAGQVRFY